jgi:hypothetical protein
VVAHAAVCSAPGNLILYLLLLHLLLHLLLLLLLLLHLNRLLLADQLQSGLPLQQAGGRNGIRFALARISTYDFPTFEGRCFRIKIEGVSLFAFEREAPDLMQSAVSLPLKTNELRAFRVADLSDFSFR